MAFENDITEFSLQFDLLYRNLTSTSAPGITEYEKSVLLTESQEEIVKGLYNGGLGKPFENDEEVTDYLASLVKQITVAAPVEDDENYPKLSSDSAIFPFGDIRLMYILLEKCTLTGDMFTCDGGSREVEVVPVTHDEYHRTKRNPFRGPGKTKALRLLRGYGDDGLELFGQYNAAEIIPPKGATVSNYVMRYLMRPYPIILEELPGGLTIDGEHTPMTCQLPKALHQPIIENAVAKAKAIWAQ